MPFLNPVAARAPVPATPNATVRIEPPRVDGRGVRLFERQNNAHRGRFRLSRWWRQRLHRPLQFVAWLTWFVDGCFPSATVYMTVAGARRFQGIRPQSICIYIKDQSSRPISVSSCIYETYDLGGYLHRIRWT